MQNKDSFFNNGENTELKSRSIFLFSILIVLTIFIYTLRLFSMQIIEGVEYKEQSELVSSKTKTISANRGEIFDRNYSMPLATNSDSWAIYITPGEIPKNRYDSVLTRLSSFINVSKTEIDSKIPESYKNSFTEVEILSYVPFSIISDVAENINDLPGVSWRAKQVRNYNFSTSLSHIIGYVGNINTEELQILYNKGYSSNSIVGKTGIEKEYDTLLQGTDGSESRTVDVRGRLVSDKPIITPPVSGNDIVLTIDSRIQQLAEKALGDRIGVAIVLSPKTGELLASVSYPYFDSNMFSAQSYGNEYSKLLQDEHNPLLNRVVNAEYPTASTFKTIMSTALIEEDLFPVDEEIECISFLDYGDRTFHCHVKRPGHGPLDLKNALAQSCNVYFWTVGRDYLGEELIFEYSKIFGYGKDLKIDLPNAKAGFVPSKEWKERRFHEKWLGGDTMNLSIGQGYSSVTPLHVANSMAMIFNEGVIYRPHVLKEIRNAEGEVVSTTEPEILHDSDISTKTWETVKEYLRYTVSDGSAQYPLNNKDVIISGKTGTAQVTGYTENYHSWFVSYGYPTTGTEDDAVVVCVLVEAANDWEWWAPYATNIIYQGIFQNQTFEESVDSLGFGWLVKSNQGEE